MAFLIDTTKQALALRTHHYNVIVDDSRRPLPGELAVNGRPVIALCPITDDNEPICEGAFSFAPLVQRALETEANRAFVFELQNSPEDVRLTIEKLSLAGIADYLTSALYIRRGRAKGGFRMKRLGGALVAHVETLPRSTKEDR